MSHYQHLTINNAERENRQWAQKSVKKQQVTRPSGRKQSHGRGQAREFPSRPERQMKRDLRGKKPCTPPRLRRASRAAAPGNSRTVFVSLLSRARTRFIPGAGPRRAPVFPGAPAVGKSRGCAEQFAHRVCFLSASRTHAVHSKCGPVPVPCFPKQAESPRLRRAIRASSLCTCPDSHARGLFRVRTCAGLLFSRARSGPAPAPGKPRGEKNFH